MTEQRAQQIIVTATFVTIASTSLAELKAIPKAAGLKPSHTIVGAFFAMLGCSIIAELDPRTGAYLAIMVAGGVAINYGLPTLESYYEGEKEVGKGKGGSPIGHPGKKIVGTKIVKNKAGGPVEVPIYR